MEGEKREEGVEMLNTGAVIHDTETKVDSLSPHERV